jgi:hypothetical protein
MAYRRIRVSNEFTGPLDDLTKAYTNIGYQEGLKDGYQYAADGVDITETPFYDADASQKSEEAASLFANTEPPLLIIHSASYC